jgi:hypothetical protein
MKNGPWWHDTSVINTIGFVIVFGVVIAILVITYPWHS